MYSCTKLEAKCVWKHSESTYAEPYGSLSRLLHRHSRPDRCSAGWVGCISASWCTWTGPTDKCMSLKKKTVRDNWNKWKILSAIWFKWIAVDSLSWKTVRKAKWNEHFETHFATVLLTNSNSNIWIYSDRTATLRAAHPHLWQCSTSKYLALLLSLFITMNYIHFY